MNRCVALATCAALPDGHPDDALLLTALRHRGVEAFPVVWDDPDVDWADFDLTVIRSTWDYTERRDEFVAWAKGVPRLANPADVVAWNTDKRYLDTLAEAGVPVVPTTWVLPGERWQPPAVGNWVVKPAVSASSRDTGRYDLADPDQRGLAVALVDRMHRGGRVAMVQPYLKAVDTYGETALVYLGGEFSHAVGKSAMLDGPYREAADPDERERIEPRTPTAEQLATAERVLTACGADDRLLYARVDLIPGTRGEPLLVELELTEPSLFLRHAQGSGDRFAAAIEMIMAT